LIVHYEYDDLNQLIRENNHNLEKTITYTYDFGGNIQKKDIYNYTDGDLSSATLENTIVYEYSDSNWKDKLTSYNNQAIIYDGLGNPLVYRDDWNFEWIRGKKLDKASKTGYNVSYKYDDGGIRTQKVVNGVTTDFVTSAIQVLAQKSGDNTIVWQFGGNGTVVGFNYNGTQYFYLKNAQGDIVGITDIAGNILVEYVYDSWGKQISVTDDSTFGLAEINPLRYRGYYFDSETNLYYLNARYYDPETGRFISADDNLVGSLNLFEYCYNNPINLSDSNGQIPWQVLYTFKEALIDAAININTASLIDNKERAVAIIKQGAIFIYSDSVIGTDTELNLTDLQPLENYLGTNLEVILHSHGKYKFGAFNNSFSGKKGDKGFADENEIRLGLVSPNGSVQLYDARKTIGDKTPHMVLPALNSLVPHDEFYNSWIGKWFA
jgi:RHS repeat-associated protein